MKSWQENKYIWQTKFQSKKTNKVLLDIVGEYLPCSRRSKSSVPKFNLYKAVVSMTRTLRTTQEACENIILTKSKRSQNIIEDIWHVQAHKDWHRAWIRSQFFFVSKHQFPKEAKELIIPLNVTEKSTVEFESVYENLAF
jgi:hypothetical protein